MKIIKAEHSGYCFGVKRAIKTAQKMIEEVKNEEIFMLGEIIHNPQVVKEFQEKGVRIVTGISQVPSHKYLITRAHGISKSEILFARQKDIKLIDTTCPYVHQLKQIASFLEKENYTIVIFGDINHPEIQSLLSYITREVKVIQSVDEIKSPSFDKKRKIGMISQTTKNMEQYRKVILEIFKHVDDELRIYNTICKATKLRQDATRRLAQEVDLMIVVGGKNSANTNRLAHLCKEIGVETYHIETEKQLTKQWFYSKHKIGISSGASTPDYLTENVIRKIKMMKFD